MGKRPLYFEIFTTALGSLLLEIAYTRIFSFKVFYYFTYLVLGMGLLGIGAGGIAVATSERLRRMPVERLIALAAFAGGASVLVGFLVISPLQMNIAEALTAPLEIGKLVLIMLLLTSSFFCVGLIVSAILSARPEAASRLYAADLIGAALGCTLSVPLVYWLTPPRTVLLAGFILALGGLRCARASRPLLAVGVGVATVLAIPALIPGLLPDPVVANSKQFEDYRREKLVRFSQWSPVFRVDVMDHPFKLGNEFVLFHDGQPGAGMVRFTPDYAHFKYLDRDARLLPFRVLPAGPRVLIIGAAGGQEIAASLYFGASHVTAVELNPVSYSLLRNEFADITGRLAEHPKVTHINGDGRWFLKQTNEQYDLIWFPAPDSYAAMNASSAGAFVLSESYLYTVEMIRQSLAHLTPRGIVCTQFGEFSHDSRPNRTTRYLATARAAFADEGTPDFARHALVASTEGLGALKESAILLGKDTFTDAEVARFTEHAQRSVNEGAVRYAPGMPANDSPITQAILVPDRDLERWHTHQPYAVHAIRDDAPFFWHFARFSDAIEAPLPVDGKMIDPEDAIAEQVTLAFLVLATLFAGCFLLVPLFTIRKVWKELPHKAAALAYFAALGLGFMFLEVALIQKLTLLLGYPTYALSVTLCGLLVFSGIGSLLSSRYSAERNRALYAVLAVLCVVVIASQAALPRLIDAFVGSALPLRVAVALLVLAPVGLCLGAFMPIGLRSVASSTPHAREYVAWAWAVNGFFSVIASILATILAMVFGFRVLMLVALGIYVLGVVSFARLPAGSATSHA
ncbi:MAG TPA: hypothetical protein VI072_07090 [Polyangiaceae bacterium]